MVGVQIATGYNLVSGVIDCQGVVFTRLLMAFENTHNYLKYVGVSLMR